MKKAGLPKFTQEPIIHVDATPDKEYPLRILRAHRENCNVKWVCAVDEKLNTHPLLVRMNKACDKRAEFLDRAIKILEGKN